jgi:stage II sporulation protein D
MRIAVNVGFPRQPRRNLLARNRRPANPAAKAAGAGARRALACAALVAASLLITFAPPTSAAAQIVVRVGLVAGAPVGECAVSGLVPPQDQYVSQRAPRVELLGGDGHALAQLGSAPARVVAVGNEVVVSDGTGRESREARLTVGARDGLVALQRGAAAPRPYRGMIEISAAGGVLRAVNVVGLEDYVRSVVAAEMSPRFHPQALMAQAILARTYALRAASRHAKAGFDLCDTNHCQAYAGALAETPQTTTAVEATRGLVLTFGGEIADVNYHSTCGGHTAAAWEVWPGAKRPPHLAGASDEVNGVAACARSPQFRWTADISAADLLRISGAGDRVGLPRRLAVTRTSREGRAAQVEIAFNAGAVSMTGQDFYLRCAGALGWGVVKSAWFDVTATSGGWRLTGRGAGHGVGLCQWGAQGRAEAGASMREILAAYFPGAEVRQLDDSGATIAGLAHD